MVAKSKKKYNILVVSLFLICFFAMPLVNVNAETNKTYGEQVTVTDSIAADEESDTGTIVGLFSAFFLFLGKAVETVVSWLFGLLSGSATFPWSDKIIFNTIPILDINFINPAEGSLFDIGNIGGVVRNIYFTGLAIAASFLGIVVGVMSIRMAITTIAAQKARYKESIVALLTTLVLLFGMHFILSALFYVNEKMVEVASTIVSNQQVPSSSDSDVKVKISDMGKYFYDQAKKQGGGRALLIFDKAAPIPTVLYLTFIFQSILFLFAYLKRFFYVIILAVIGPFVVIYDFLGKAIS